MLLPSMASLTRNLSPIPRRADGQCAQPNSAAPGSGINSRISLMTMNWRWSVRELSAPGPVESFCWAMAPRSSRTSMRRSSSTKPRTKTYLTRCTRLIPHGPERIPPVHRAKKVARKYPSRPPLLMIKRSRRLSFFLLLLLLLTSVAICFCLVDHTSALSAALPLLLLLSSCLPCFV